MFDNKDKLGPAGETHGVIPITRSENRDNSKPILNALPHKPPDYHPTEPMHSAIVPVVPLNTHPLDFSLPHNKEPGAFNGHKADSLKPHNPIRFHVDAPHHDPAHNHSSHVKGGRTAFDVAMHQGGKFVWNPIKAANHNAAVERQIFKKGGELYGGKAWYKKIVPGMKQGVDMIRGPSYSDLGIKIPNGDPVIPPPTPPTTTKNKKAKGGKKFIFNPIKAAQEHKAETIANHKSFNSGLKIEGAGFRAPRRSHVAVPVEHIVPMQGGKFKWGKFIQDITSLGANIGDMMQQNSQMASAAEV